MESTRRIARRNAALFGHQTRRGLLGLGGAAAASLAFARPSFAQQAGAVPEIRIGTVLPSRTGLIGVATFDDPILRDLRLGVQPQGGPVHEALMTRGLGNNIVAQFANTYGTNPNPLGAPFEALVNGEVDVMLMWGGGAGYLAAQQPIPLKVVPVPPFEPPFIPMFINVAMGVRPGDESFRDLLDAAIAETWDQIYEVLNEFHVPLMELPRPTLTIDAPVR